MTTYSKKIWRNFKRWFFLCPLVYTAKWLMRFLVTSCRIEIEGIDSFINHAMKDKSILVLWHNRLLILPEILHKYAPQFFYRAVISKSTDGELLAILANSYSAGRTLRVPHNARHQALSQMIKQLKDSQEVIIVTPDGPRGPRYRMKPGVVVASNVAGATIFPLTWSADRFWQLNTWDKMVLPKPFSRIKVRIGEPIVCVTEEGQPLTTHTKALEAALLDLDMEVCKEVSEDPHRWPA